MFFAEVAIDNFSADTLDKLSLFLKYGPLGLAGLMLVLVVIALALGELTPARERTLKRLMVVGATCFIAALAGSLYSAEKAYPIHFQVYPLTAGKKAKRVFPEPIITINNEDLGEDKTYVIKSEVTAIVDVNDAIIYARKIRSVGEQQQAALSEIANSSSALMTDLKILYTSCGEPDLEPFGNGSSGKNWGNFKSAFDKVSDIGSKATGLSKVTIPPLD